jgi:hypothetical protein
MEKREIHFSVNGEKLVAYSEHETARLSVREILDLAGCQPAADFCLAEQAPERTKHCDLAETLEVKQHEEFLAVSKEQKVKVDVHYIAATKPFEHDFARSATVQLVKADAMKAFELSEGANAEGNTVTYTLYEGKTPLENLGQTVGELAGQKSELRLKLVQQITQG